MSLIAMLDAAKDPREAENIGRLIVSRRRTIRRTQRFITLIEQGEQNGTNTKEKPKRIDT